MSGPNNFVYTEAVFMDEFLLSIFHAIQSIVSTLTMALYLMLLYVVVLHSPKNMGTYK